MDIEPPFVHGEAGERSAQIINVELGKGLAVVAICSALCGIAAVLAAWSAYQSNLAYTESRMVQYYLQDPSFRSREELEQWARYKHEQEKGK